MSKVKLQIQNLLSNKLKPEESGLTSGYTLLMLKAEEGNINEVHRMITELKNVDINASNKRGYTALAIAVKAGHLDVVKLLLYSGSNPNAKNNSGQSPLFLACWNNYEDIVRLLLDSGAEINAVDHRGWTPLMISAYHGHKQILKELLSRNADTTVQDLFGKRAIDRAKDAEVIQILQSFENLESRPNIISTNPKENISLQYSPIPFLDTEKKAKKDYQPTSILKKSNSKSSVGISRVENEYNKSIRSPQTPQSGLLSAHKTSSAASAQRKTVSTIQRPSTQTKTTQHSQQPRKEPQSAGKSTPLLKSLLNDTTSPKTTTNSKRISASPLGGGLQRQVFKEDMEKLLHDQMDFMNQKIQQVVEQKISLEVPMQMQDYENQFKNQVESLLKFKATDIFKNLQAIFSLKLKFCLSRLGYDTTSLDVTPFLESGSNFNTDMINFSQEPRRTYNDKEFRAIENDINKLEKSIQSHKLSQPSTLRRSQVESPSYGDHQCDHTSQVHRSEIRNDLLDQMTIEMKSNTDRLMDYSKSKVIETTREESGMLYKKIVAEVTDNMEALESELKRKFEEIITHKLNRVIEVLGSAAQNSNTLEKTRSLETENNASLSQKNYYSTSEYESRASNIREDKFEHQLSQDIRKDLRYSDVKASESLQRGQQEISQAKEKILRIKNSLNFMDDEDSEPRSGGLQQSQGNSATYNRNDRVSRFEDEGTQSLSGPVKTEEGHEDLERTYDPTYRSTTKTETSQPMSNREYWSQPDVRNSSITNKPINKGGQSIQHRGTTDSKNGTKQAVPAHRFAFTDQKEQELIKCYDFSHE